MSFKDFGSKIKENISNNLTNILLAFYLMFYIVWNNLTPLITGDISLAIFLNLVVNGVNIPVLMIVSLILTGKYKSIDASRSVDLTLADKNMELALQEQQIKHLKELTVAYKSNDELKKDIAYQREIAEYRVQSEVLKGRIEKSIEANKDWNDTNEALKDQAELIAK